MKKLLAAAFISLFTLTANAGLGEWQLVSENHYFASDNESFMSLQAMFPQHFSDVDGTAVSSATLDLYFYKFAGPSTCSPDDTRLNAETVSKSLCFSDDSNCMATATSLPPPFDPCL